MGTMKLITVGSKVKFIEPHDKDDSCVEYISGSYIFIKGLNEKFYDRESSFFQTFKLFSDKEEKIWIAVYFSFIPSYD